jgi:hypothetical protein
MDKASDLVAGIMLSQIVYWHLPDREGRSRLRVERDGRQWIARARTEWWDECRISPREADKALQALRRRNLVETRLFRFDGAPTTHLSINQEAFIEAWTAVAGGPPDWSDLPESEKSISPDPQNPFAANGEIHLPESVKSITETTAETTTETTTTGAATPNDDVVVALLQALKDQGVTASVAERIVRRHAPEHIRLHLDMLPYRSARDPAATLVRAIEENWAPPGSWRRSAEERRADRAS